MKNLDIVITVSFGDHGLPRLPPPEGATLTASARGGEVTLRGNARGLRFLATALLGLAEADAEDVSQGFHVHLDDLYALNGDGASLILRRDD